MISLSVVIPVFNEEKTIGKTLSKLDGLNIPGVNKEILIVDDGSTDNTLLKIDKFLKTNGNKSINIIKHSENHGKGMAVRTGIAQARGEYIVIQDADLEYDPKYLSPLMTPIKLGKARVVYGTRLKRMPNLKGEEKTIRFLMHFSANRVISFIISIMFDTWLTDIETGYKIFPRKVFKKLNIQSEGFEFEPELTIKLLQRGYKIVEIPIKTVPRDYSQGKKFKTFSDGPKAIWAIIKYKFIS